MRQLAGNDDVAGPQLLCPAKRQGMIGFKIEAQPQFTIYPDAMPRGWLAELRRKTPARIPMLA